MHGRSDGSTPLTTTRCSATKAPSSCWSKVSTRSKSGLLATVSSARQSELVNFKCTEAVHLEEGASEVALTDGQTATVSRRLAPKLKRRLGMNSDMSLE